MNREDHDKGGDIIDKAGRAERMFLVAALDQQRATLAPEQHPDFDGESCVGCGCEIPAGRLALSKVRCVLCQTKIEQATKHRG